MMNCAPLSRTLASSGLKSLVSRSNFSSDTTWTPPSASTSLMVGSTPLVQTAFSDRIAALSRFRALCRWLTTKSPTERAMLSVVCITRNQYLYRS